MPSQMFVEIFAARSRALKAEGEALARLAHNGLLGAAREGLARQLLSPLLPPDIEILTGTIVSWDPSNRTERNQDDLVLFNRRLAPVLWAEPGCAVMPVDGVAAHIDVKSTLKSADVDHAVRAAAEVISLDSSHGVAPAGLIFAYDSDLSGTNTTELDRLLSALANRWHPKPGQATSPIQVLCVAGKGCWILTEHPTTKATGWFFVRPVSEREVLAFVSMISNYLYLRHHSARGAGAYLLDLGWLEGPVAPCSLVSG